MQALSNYSNVGVPGRFIFRIDEWIQPAGCADIDFDQKSIHFSWGYVNYVRLHLHTCHL